MEQQEEYLKDGEEARLMSYRARLTDDGDIPNMESYAYFSLVAKQAEEFAAKFKARAIAETQNYLGKESGECTVKGIKYAVRGGRKLWDFSHIQRHVDTKAELSNIERAAIASYEATVKGQTHVSEDGEVITPAVLKGVSETSLSVKIA